MLVNIAQTIAMQLGLDQPESIQDFSRTKRKLTLVELSEAAKMWSCSSLTYFSISSTYGMLPVSSNGMVDLICDEESAYDIPIEMKHQLLIARFSARTNKYMSRSMPFLRERTCSKETSGILGLLEQEYSDLCRGLGQALTAETEILLIGTGIQLYVFYLLDTGQSLARKIGLLGAFDFAKSLINKLQQLDATADIIKYSPFSYFRMATLAALFILRLEDSSFVGLVDVDGGKQAFNTALMLLRRASLEDNDLPGRTSKILVELWSAQAAHGRVVKSLD
ncbi:uncharacterized protein N7496_007615 [Penicillium cataractarum]|uniref:Transcription factor domain-containing protein n=1 Tax=Penicillium cataractarum TaxID=2100454 RepID=A0A9W9S3S6_9EURO|nr:uncharacterized protein N7496_007615 [Penicillium cataractarum]KAJ5371523.1 hypothetical protein N7496_007615 [Penicillium cataractarum]